MGAGGKGSTSSQSVSIPPEVLARYNSINARAEDVASTPFVSYSQDPRAFVAPLTGSQRAGIQNVNAVQGMAQPSINTGQNIVAEGLRQGAPLQQQAINTIGGARGLGDVLYGGSLGTSAQGTQAGRQLYGQSLDTSGQGLGAASNIYAQSLAAIPQAVNTGRQYAGLAGDYLSGGTRDVNAQQFSGEALQPFMSPYINSVVKSQQALQEQENAKQRSAMTGDAIKAGAFGGDRAGIAQAELGRQQSLANQATLSNILQSGYGQAANQFSQQQGINLSADQANRVAQQYGAQQAAALGQQQYGQGLGAAQAAAGLGQSLYGMGAQQAGLQQSAAQGVGTQAQQQAAMQQQAAQGLFGQAAQQAAVQQSSGQNLYNMGLGGGQAYAGLGVQGQNTALQGAQAQMGAGQMEQQTNQAGLSALYNQFLQQQGFPYQQAQFLGNIAMGTGALSGSTTQTTQPSFSDRRLKEDVKAVGETFDGQPIYRYRMKGENRPQLGLMAQEVEGAHPEAVGLAGGYKTVDYDKATEKAAKRGHFAGGGVGGDGMGGMGEGGFGGSAAESSGGMDGGVGGDGMGGMDGSTGGDGDGSGNLYPEIAQALAAVASAAKPAAPVYRAPYERQTPLTYQPWGGSQSQSTEPTRNAFGFYSAPSTGAGQYGGSYGMPQSSGKMPQASGKGPSSSGFASGGRVGFADGGSAADYINMLGMSGTDLAKAQAAMYANAPWSGASGAGDRIKHTLQAPKGGLALPAPPRERPNAVQGAASVASGLEKLWDVGEKGAEGLGKLLGDKDTADMTKKAWDKIDPDLLGSIFKADGGSVGEEDDDAPLGLYAPPGKGINIPDEKPTAKLATASGGGGGGGGKSPLGDIAAIGMLAAKFLPMLLASGGAVTRHGYATDGAVEDTSPDVAAALEQIKKNVAYRPAPETMDFLKREVMPKESGGEYNAIYSPDGKPITFDDYSDHPRRRSTIPAGQQNAGMTSDAAGGYQFLGNTWAPIKEKLGLPDFSPASQDTAAGYLAETDYKKRTGRDLASDLASGDPEAVNRAKVALTATWPTLGPRQKPGLGAVANDTGPREPAAPPAIPSSIMAMMDTQPAEKPAAKERSFMDSLTSKDFLLPALSAIGSYMAAGAPTQAGALGAAVMGGTGTLMRQQQLNSMLGKQAEETKAIPDRIGIERQTKALEAVKFWDQSFAQVPNPDPAKYGNTPYLFRGPNGELLTPSQKQTLLSKVYTGISGTSFPVGEAIRDGATTQGTVTAPRGEGAQATPAATPPAGDRVGQPPAATAPASPARVEATAPFQGVEPAVLNDLIPEDRPDLLGVQVAELRAKADSLREAGANQEDVERITRQAEEKETRRQKIIEGVITPSVRRDATNPKAAQEVRDAFRKWTMNVPENEKIVTALRPEMNAVEANAATLANLADIFSTFEAGKFEDVKADVAGKLLALGFNVPESARNSAADLERVTKDSMKLALDALLKYGNKAPATELNTTSKTVPTGTMQPKAVRDVLGGLIGETAYAKKYQNDLAAYAKNNQGADLTTWTAEWQKANPMAKFKDEAKANLAVRGSNPQNWGDANPGWVYIIEPKAVGPDDKPLFDKPTKMRFLGIDAKTGYPEFAKVK
jgi:muramidase (phage lysozyme)